MSAVGSGADGKGDQRSVASVIPVNDGGAPEGRIRGSQPAASGRVCAGAFAALKPISLGSCLFYMAISVDSGHSTASYRYRGSITPRAHLLEKVGSACRKSPAMAGLFRIDMVK